MFRVCLPVRWLLTQKEWSMQSASSECGPCAYCRRRRLLQGRQGDQSVHLPSRQEQQRVSSHAPMHRHLQWHTLAAEQIELQLGNRKPAAIAAMTQKLGCTAGLPQPQASKEHSGENRVPEQPPLTEAGDLVSLSLRRMMRLSQGSQTLHVSSGVRATCCHHRLTVCLAGVPVSDRSWCRTCRGLPQRGPSCRACP